MLVKISYKSRIVIFTILFTLVLASSCLVAYSIYTPKYQQQLDYKNQTQTAIPTSTATVTQTLTPTLTPTPTLTNTAIPTPSFTPPPEVVSCLGNVLNGEDIYTYVYPSSVMVDKSLVLMRNQEVSVIGRLQDGPWIKVKINGNERWMNSSDVEINSACIANTFDLSFLLGEAESNRMVVMDETFSTNKYGWVDSKGENIYPIIGNSGNDQIKIDTTSNNYIYSKTVNLENLDDFRLITSFTRYGHNKEKASVGILFGINGKNHYLVTLSSTCQIQLEGNGNIIYQKQLTPTVCSDVDNYWVIDKLENGEISITINESDPITVILPSEYNNNLMGNIGYEVRSSQVFFEYIVLTTSK